MDKLRGGCLCGAIRYTALGPLRDLVFCHCAQCRKQSGLYFAATAVDQANLAVYGEQALHWYAASAFASRGFCNTCGSVLFWKPSAARHMAILAGSFDEPSDLQAGYHVCTKDLPTFYTINDGLPQYLHSAPGLVIDTP